MRRILPLTLLIACAPATGVVDLSNPGPTDPVEETVWLPCDGSWLPELPDYPTDGPALTGSRGPVEDAGWEPALPASAMDPTTSAFDVLAAVPSDVLARFPLAWPEIPVDPSDQTGALRLDRRFGDGEWQPVEVTRFDDQGRVVAQWFNQNSLVVRRWDGDGRSYSERHWFFRDKWFTAAQSHTVVTDRWHVSRTDRGSLDGTFDGEWRERFVTVHRYGDPRFGFDADQFSMDLDGRPIGGSWTRWLDEDGPHDFDAEPVRLGARGHVTGGRLARGEVPLLITDGGQTLFQWPQPDQAWAKVICPSNDGAAPADQLELWFDGEGAGPSWIRSQVHDGAGGWVERQDLDGDGRFEQVVTTTFDSVTGERRSVAVRDDGSGPFEEWTTVETLDDRGVVLASRTVRADGTSIETRRVVVE